MSDAVAAMLGERPADGFVYDMPEEQYHASPGLSQSRMKLFLKCPLKGRYGEVEETASMRLGTLAHTAILQPELVDRRYAAVDLERLNPKDGAYKEASARAGGRELVRRPVYEQAMRLRDAVYSQSPARALFEAPGRSEVSMYWTDPKTGLLLRGRADRILDTGGILDVKSTTDASKDAARRKSKQLGYHVQNANYAEGNGILAGCDPLDIPMVFIFIETAYPHAIGCYELDEAAFLEGRDLCRQAVDGWAACERSGIWPSYYEGIEQLSLSRGAIGDMEGI